MGLHSPPASTKSPMAVRRSSHRQRPSTPARLFVLLVVLVVLLAIRTLTGQRHHGPTDVVSPRPPVVSISATGSPMAGEENPTALSASALPGTCLAYAPLRGDRHETVFVDPGHGGLDPGTSG